MLQSHWSVAIPLECCNPIGVSRSHWNAALPLKRRRCFKAALSTAEGTVAAGRSAPSIYLSFQCEGDTLTGVRLGFEAEGPVGKAGHRFVASKYIYNSSAVVGAM